MASLWQSKIIAKKTSKFTRKKIIQFCSLQITEKSKLTLDPIKVHKTTCFSNTKF